MVLCLPGTSTPINVFSIVNFVWTDKITSPVLTLRSVLMVQMNFSHCFEKLYDMLIPKKQKQKKKGWRRSVVQRESSGIVVINLFYKYWRTWMFQTTARNNRYVFQSGQPTGDCVNIHSRLILLWASEELKHSTLWPHPFKYCIIICLSSGMLHQIVW
jgi:hypothetical protein